MFNPDAVTALERERRLKEGERNETKTAKTISMGHSYWALAQQIKTKHNLKGKGFNSVIAFCIYEIGWIDGLES